jgi:hypothetical protein
MKDVHPQMALLERVVAVEQLAKLDPTRGHLEHDVFQDIRVHPSLAVTVQQTHVVQERSLVEFLFRDQVEGPSLLSRKRPADCQLALDDRPSNTVGGFDLHETLSAIDHFNQEIRHDVTRAGAFLSLARYGGRAVEKLDLDGAFRASPSVPDRQGLLLDVNHLGTGNQDYRRCGLKLSLATNRAALLGTRHQQERARCTPP